MKPPFRSRNLSARWESTACTECVGASLRASHSARHARRPGWHVVKGQGHRDAGVIAHQGDYVGDADMAQCLDRTVIKALWYPTRISEGHRHLVDNLLALVRERSLQAGDDGFDLIGWQRPTSLPRRSCALVGKAECHLLLMIQTAISRSRSVRE